MPPKGGKKAKSPPILSHEFFIKNHGDIASCSVILILIALMFQATQPFAAKFVSLHHNVTVEGAPEHINFYTYGPVDFLAVFFYALLAIVMHAFIQEFILDKVNRRMHLSKIKHSKFNESGQLLVFYIVSICWAFALMNEDDYVGGFHKLWAAYPHNALTWRTKMFMIVQMAYWLHWYPELYLQKVKKEELADRLTYITLYIGAVYSAYFLSFAPFAIVLLFIHYIGEAIFQATRLVYFAERNNIAKYGFMVWNIVFPLVRLIVAGLAIFVLFHQMEATVIPKIDFTTGNFNTRSIRMVCLAYIVLSQMWLLWRFITFFLRHRRERSKSRATKQKKSVKPSAKTSEGSEIDSAPENSTSQTTPANGSAVGVTTRRRK